MGILHQDLDPKSGKTTYILTLQDNEAAFSICSVNFQDKEHGTIVAIGTVKDFEFWDQKELFRWIYSSQKICG